MTTTRDNKHLYLTTIIVCVDMQYTGHNVNCKCRWGKGGICKMLMKTVNRNVLIYLLEILEAYFIACCLIAFPIMVM